MLTREVHEARAVITAMADVAHQAATRCANEAAGFDAQAERRWDAIARAIESAMAEPVAPSTHGTSLRRRAA